MFIVGISLGISILFENIGEVHENIKGIVFIIAIILYEPILISFGCTVGQLITNIRVSDYVNPKKRIWFIQAILRLIVKGLLGWLSFITVTFNRNRRAIHDYISYSIVIVHKKPAPNSVSQRRRY